MSKEFTWPEVAHYYMRNAEKPNVYVLRNANHVPAGIAFYWNNLPPRNTDLPVLTDIADITEEHAAHVLDLVKAQPHFDGVWTAREMLLEPFENLSATVSGTVIRAALGCPDVIHFLIRENYNVFNVPTYKEPQP